MLGTDRMSKKDIAIKALEEFKSAFMDIAELVGDCDLPELGKAFNNSQATEIYSDIFNKSFDELYIPAWCDLMIRAISKAETVYTTYAPDTDITFIMKDTEKFASDPTRIVRTTECIGWYHGEPDEDLTKLCANGNMKATYEDPID